MILIGYDLGVTKCIWSGDGGGDYTPGLLLRAKALDHNVMIVGK